MKRYCTRLSPRHRKLCASFIASPSPFQATDGPRKHALKPVSLERGQTGPYSPERNQKNRSVNGDTRMPDRGTPRKKTRTNHEKKLNTYFRRQSLVAAANSSHTDRKFSYQVSVKLAISCSAVRPAMVTPEWTMSPQVCTRVPFPACSSKLTHWARTTPREWSIHPTL